MNARICAPGVLASGQPFLMRKVDGRHGCKSGEDSPGRFCTLHLAMIGALTPFGNLVKSAGSWHRKAGMPVIALSLSELPRSRVMLRDGTCRDLPPVAGDRVQLQVIASLTTHMPPDYVACNSSAITQRSPTASVLLG
jgi:hypothetical protein